MRRLLLILALILSAVSAPTYVWALDDGLPGVKLAGSDPELPPALQEQRDRGAQIYYLGKFDTLDGWVMIRTGQPEFYYATPGNKALVMGILFDDKGQMMTGEQLKKLELARSPAVNNMMQSQMAPNPRGPSPTDVPAPDAGANTNAPAKPAIDANVAGLPPIKTDAEVADAAAKAVPDSPAGRLFTEVQATSNVLWGKADAPAFWAFLDPNCTHCQYFIKQIEPFVTAGQIAVHIIPVGYDDKSRSQAALVLGAADGPARLLAYAKGQTDVLPVSKDIDIKSIIANTTLLSKWHLSATPTIVYQAGKGGIKLIRGRPLDINAAVADLKG